MIKLLSSGGSNERNVFKCDLGETVQDPIGNPVKIQGRRAFCQYLVNGTWYAEDSFKPVEDEGDDKSDSDRYVSINQRISQLEQR